MIKLKLIFAVICIVILHFAILVFQPLWSQEEVKRIDDNKPSPPSLYKRTSTFDRGVAFMDAGEMQVNGVENNGVIGRDGFEPYCKHGYWGEIRWIIPFLGVPKQSWATQIQLEDGRTVDRSQYFNCIESITIHFGTGVQGYSYTDWEAQDNANTQLMGDDTYGNTPLIATSTRPNSWPEGYFDKDPMSPTYKQFIETPGERHWPGYWALDPDPESPTFGQEIEGEFVSSKDIFYIMNDKYNGIRLGDEVNVGFPIGFDMEVSGYSYGTRVYEDIVFFNYNLIYRDDITDPSRQYHNGTIDSLYFGFLIDPDLPGRDPEGNTGYEPGWAEDDYCIADTDRNIFVMFDKDAYCKDVDAPYNEGPISAIAVAYLKTPKDVGLTGFHFFSQEDFDAEPGGQKMERIIYAMASGKKEILALQDQQKYFHGDDPHFDDLSQLQSWQEKDPPGSRVDPWFMITSGPFSASPGDTLELHFCIVGGRDDPGPLDAAGFPTNPYEVRFKDVLDNYDKAMDLYSNKFIGTGPPLTPTLNAAGTKTLDDNNVPVIYAEDGKVTLYWDDAAEKSKDILTKEEDFEGYKIYKAYFDRDRNYIDWGQEIYEITPTGTVGDILGYVPVFQCDLDNDYSGIDPFQSWFYVGNNSGIVHSWTDTDVINGVRYRYCITAYDRYYEDRQFNCNETTRGNSPKDFNVVDVIPGVRPTGFISPGAYVTHTRGQGKGSIDVEIVDPNNITDHTYHIAFIDSPGVNFQVIDATNDMILVDSYPINDENIPITDGFRVAVNSVGVFGGISSIEDEFGNNVEGNENTDVNNSWYVDGVEFRGDFEAKISDYEIRFTSSGSAVGTRLSPNVEIKENVPFEVWNTTSNVQINAIVLDNGDLKYNEGERIYIVNSAYENLSIGSTYSLNIINEVPLYVTIFNAPADTMALPPVEGQIVKITTNRAHTPKDLYEITFDAIAFSKTTESDLDMIRVVPNPYVVSSKTELYTGSSSYDQHEVRFTHLPPKCTINIFTLTGDKVRTIEHESQSYGEARWDLLSEENLEVSYGIYIYVVKIPDGTVKVGKMAIVK